MFTLEFPGRLGVRTRYFHPCGPGSIPGLGSEIPHQAAARRGHTHTHTHTHTKSPLTYLISPVYKVGSTLSPFCTHEKTEVEVVKSLY